MIPTIAVPVKKEVKLIENQKKVTKTAFASLWLDERARNFKEKKITERGLDEIPC